MNIFLDTANLDEITRWRDRGVLDGITTNPSLLSKLSVDPRLRIKEICALMKDGLVSIEVTEKSSKDVYAQAHRIAQLGNNVLVKIPCHVDYYEVIAKLAHDGIRMNITLVFSLMQSLMMAKLGVTYISPFIGRLEDTGGSGSDLIMHIRQMLDAYGFSTKICAASLHDGEQLKDVLLAGAHTATLPPELLTKIVQHPLTDSGIERFNSDWKKVGIDQFP